MAWQRYSSCVLCGARMTESVCGTPKRVGGHTKARPIDRVSESLLCSVLFCGTRVWCVWLVSVSVVRLWFAAPVLLVKVVLLF